MALFTISSSSKKLKFVCIAAVLVAIVVVALALYFTLRPKTEELRIFKGAVVTNGPGCSNIGIDIMSKGGTVADVAIAVLFCEGIAMPQSMGLGGGFLLTMYKRETGETISLNARETAPLKATEDMYSANASLSLRGGLSVAVPGELRGYWELYQRYGGGVPWKDLVQPSIDICNNGINVVGYIARILKQNKEVVRGDPLLSEIFINPLTNDVYVEGDVYKRPKLAKTLERIAKEGGDTLHNGSLTESLVQDIQSKGGIITVEDMNNYSPKWQTPIKTTLNNGRTLLSQPLPGSGPIIAMIINILNDYLDVNHPESLDNYQKIIESFKFAYAQRTKLGDEEFVNVTELVANIVSKSYAENIKKLIQTNYTSNRTSYYGANTTLPDDHGTANLCILSTNGDAIVVTSTINYIFGAGFVSESTGIILNDEMDDFSSKNQTNVYNFPPSPANFIAPGKHPLSSMSPTIILDENGDVILLVGAAGGSKIITGIVQIIVRHLMYGTEVTAASNYPRLHHQLWPMRVDTESRFGKEETQILDGLKNIGHEINVSDGDGFAAATCISTRNNGRITGVPDIRRSGTATYL